MDAARGDKAHLTQVHPPPMYLPRGLSNRLVDSQRGHPLSTVDLQRGHPLSAEVVRPSAKVEGIAAVRPDLGFALLLKWT